MPSISYRAFRDHIERSSDLILTGHEHEPDHFQKYSYTGEVNEYLEGAVFQEHGRANQAGFHATFLNLSSQQQRTQSFNWEKDLFSPAGKPLWIPYSRGTRGGRKDFEISPEFEQWLDNPGATFSHPGKPEDLRLTDIYVFPNLKEFQLNRKSEFVYGSLVEGRDLLKTLGANLWRSIWKDGFASFATLVSHSLATADRVRPAITGNPGLF